MTSKSYLQGHTNAVMKGHSSRTASNTCGYYIDRLRPDFAILDVGCGPGTISLTLAQHVPQGRVVGIDTSEAVVERARQQPNLPSNCTFETASATALPFEDESFDVVQTSQVLMHIPDVLGVVRECRRVCKKGGFLAFREGDAPSCLVHPANAALEMWQRTTAQILEKGGGHPLAGRMLVRWALDTGFKASDITYTTATLMYTGGDREWFGEHMKARIGEDQTWRQNIQKFGIGTESDLLDMQKGWQAFVDDEAAVYSLQCGQIVCIK